MAPDLTLSLPAPDFVHGSGEPSSASPGSVSPTVASISPASSPSSNIVTPPNRFLLPIPTPPTNKSQSSFTLSEVGDEETYMSLPPDVLNAEVHLAANGSFVETTSGVAARELKRRYDQQIGVNVDNRSPFIITSMTNQHGKPVFRVQLKSDVEAEQARREDLDIQVANVSNTPSTAQRKRRSRMSIGGIINGSSHKSNQVSNGTPMNAVTQNKVGTDAAAKFNTTLSRKLRKTRSIPELPVAGSSDGSDLPKPSLSATGRTHSQSVTAADLPPALRRNQSNGYPPTGDAFSQMMGWDAAQSPVASSSKSALDSHEYTSSASQSTRRSTVGSGAMDRPFGPGVSFDSPSVPEGPHIMLPPILREVQSFESGMTARALPRRGSVVHISASVSRRDSDMSLNSNPSNPSSPATTQPSQPTGPSEDSRAFTRYSTDVFDVLQRYSGLPLLNALSADSKEPTIKLSLSALDSAAPRDDPRFVIWGELNPDDDCSQHEHQTDLSSSQSAISRRRSTRSSKVSNGPSESRLSGENVRRVLMAATIERWIAQLTSQLDYDELLIFFLTYRTYIDAIDLCRLLICRFHWALQESPSGSSHEVMVKQVVRLRSFVAIRFWLLTFFRVDFLPNSELRFLFANWLNTLRRDPILKRYPDALNIIIKLKKITKDCKEAHSRKKPGKTSSEQRPKVLQSIDRIFGDLSHGVHFATSLRKGSAPQEEAIESDVDLDFNNEDASSLSNNVGIQGFASFANQLGNADGPSNPATPSNSGHSSITSTSSILLQQPLHMTILQHARAAPPGSDLPLAQTPTALPVHHSALSRAVVNTIGRLGRWKRVLSSRSPNTGLVCADVSAFDLELNATGDLLTVHGGVEQYLKMLEPLPGSNVSIAETLVDRDARHSIEPSAVASLLSVDQQTISSDPPTLPPLDPSPPSITLDDVVPPDYDDESRRDSMASETSDRPESFLSQSSLGTPLDEPTLRRKGKTVWPADVVSIDDLDLSDVSSEEEVAGPSQPQPQGQAGLRKQARKLPLRRDFEFFRRSVDTVSSMGIISHPSIALSEHTDSAGTSRSASNVLGGQLHQWQVNALIADLSEDEDGEGDAEAALRRLEGQINHQRQRQKEAKVNGWVRTIQERMAAGDFREDEVPEFSDEEDGDNQSEDSYGSVVHLKDSSVTVGDSVSAQGDAPRKSLEEQAPVQEAEEPQELLTPTTEPSSTHSSREPRPASEAKPKVDEAVPPEILHSRLTPPIPSSASSSRKSSIPPTRQTTESAAFVKDTFPNLPTMHRSFILNYKSEILAQHFSLIDRELFLGINFEELVSEDWLAFSNELNVLDWGQFLKDRRLKVESQGKGKVTALSAARARFNLVVNFTISEIIMSHPNDRVMVANKFIRIAWKAYTQNGFATLVAIITGLNSVWVKRVMRRSWSRIGIWEARVFEDLRVFVTSDDDFCYIRQTIQAIMDAKPLTQDESTASTGPTDLHSTTSKSRTAQDGKPVAPQTCIPFLGVYLSQLYRHRKLPEYIDPSAPTVPVDSDPASESLAHSEVFSNLLPLPSTMQLEPLINVQKQRLIAGVIKFLVAGQHLANKMEVANFDRRLFNRCLKLRALDHDTLQRVSSLYNDH